MTSALRRKRRVNEVGQWSPIFLAPGTRFIEDVFPMNWNNDGWFGDDSNALHLLCTLFLLLHQLHLKSSGIRSWRFRTPALEKCLFPVLLPFKNIGFKKYFCLKHTSNFLFYFILFSGKQHFQEKPSQVLKSWASSQAILIFIISHEVPT